MLDTMAEPSGSNAGSFEERWLFKEILVFVAGLSTVVIASGCTARALSSHPSYAFVDTLGDNVELRHYGPRFVADVVVTGEERRARSVGFRKLAAFIFGDNRARQSISMTAPVA